MQYQQFMKSAMMRHPLAIRRSISLPAEEAELLQVIKQHNEDLIRNFQQTVFCHNSVYGKPYTARLNDLLTQTKNSVLNQNIHTLKEISGQPLQDLHFELLQLAPTYISIGNFQSMAKSRAVETLNSAMSQYGEEGGSRDTRGMSAAQLHKVADSFVQHDLSDATYLVWASLLFWIFIVAASLILIVLIIRSLAAQEWFQLVKWCVFLGFVVACAQVSSLRELLTLTFHKIVMMGQGTLGIVSVLGVIAVIVLIIYLTRPRHRQPSHPIEYQVANHTPFSTKMPNGTPMYSGYMGGTRDSMRTRSRATTGSMGRQYY
eukprot:Blabericola_migrator_1__1204@NODE_1309_length_4841_cov_86_500628_g881_i0_p3_GENE_NODE_1309_length_4841_cov_86_500628_g881_i0NODE_1309_length_4841_cov_86_500628_g881_i0_p3_ORF_typecomplete_len317_score30_05Glycophorin_A/PF01102_18/1_5e02Glycophorin_A/PF01102_18/0_18DUF1700/PF08006_11/0_034GBP_C/PF02841_14/0_039Cadherin_C_2/PF16492_5/1_8e04Cadherin_C_2/PF16492_5/0_088DUF975/PF06161_11/0_084Hum_adeno_E3A/PF05393_11/31Hum_adeno_E3A/PF05393_11/8_4MHYT/PF03707_16/0_24MHYT/PF03707_16/1_9e02ABC2_membran